MSLLSKEQTGTVRAARTVDIHGDRYVDLAVAFEGSSSSEAVGRVPLSECPGDLQPGDAVRVRFVLGVMVSVQRA